MSGRKLGAVVAALLAAAALVAVGLAWQRSGRALRPAWYAHPGPDRELRAPGPGWQRLDWAGRHRDPQAELGLAYESVAFPAVDGSTLRGWYVPGAPGATAAVVTVHGATSDRRDFLRQLPWLHAAGHPVLLFDCREHGRSDGRGRGLALGYRERHDVSAAAAWLAEARGFERIAAFGTSQGASAAILAAAEDPRIDAVLAENPYARVGRLFRDSPVFVGELPGPLLRLTTLLAIWRAAGDPFAPQPVDVVHEIAPRPLLLLHGSADRITRLPHSIALHERAGEPKELWVVPGAGHSALVNARPEAYRATVLGFLARWLDAPQAEGDGAAP